jgi:SAM-dependent methyltransferase
LAVVLDLALAAGVGVATYWLLTSLPLARVDLSALGALFGFPRWRITTVLTYLVPLLLCLGLLALRRSLAFALGLSAFAFVCARLDEPERLVYRERSFFGVLSVKDDLEGECRFLVNGSTLHGREFLDPEWRSVPLAFYHHQGPVGDIFDEFSGERSKPEIAIVGLGAGSMAAYGVPGQHITFYEIDPHVVQVARDRGLFHFISDSNARVDVVTGDARLRLAEAATGRYGLLFVDAFSSDAIPMHLLTREALDLYLDKLAPDGVLAIHVTNRYLDLVPFVGRLAAERELTSRFQSWRSRDGCGRYVTDWIVLARTEADLRGLLNGKFWEPLRVPEGTPLWTDDFSNLLAALHWGGSTH